MLKKLDIPTGPEAITLDWLNEVLQSTGTINQTSVTSHNIETMEDAPGQIGQLLRLNLGYTLAEKTAPASMIVKLSSANLEVRSTAHKGRAYEREVRFYQEFAPQAQLPTPRCYYSDIDLETGHCILLLEDLAHFKAVGFPTGCNLAETKLVIQHLAKFHACWWENPRLQNASYLLPFDYMADYWQERYQEWWSQLPQKLATQFPDIQLLATFLELGQQFGPNLAKIFTQLNEPPITLIHKDTHVDNLLFGVNAHDLPLVFLDWQAYGQGRGMVDVAYFMITSVPTALRRQAETHLLQTYHSLLLQHGVQNYTFEQCWTDYQHTFFRVLFVLTMVVGITDISGSYGRAILEAGVPRIVAFSEDHDVRKFL